MTSPDQKPHVTQNREVPNELAPGACPGWTPEEPPEPGVRLICGTGLNQQQLFAMAAEARTRGERFLITYPDYYFHGRRTARDARDSDRFYREYINDVVSDTRDRQESIAWNARLARERQANHSGVWGAVDRAGDATVGAAAEL